MLILKNIQEMSVFQRYSEILRYGIRRCIVIENISYERILNGYYSGQL
jgi:hypothetical protein